MPNTFFNKRNITQGLDGIPIAQFKPIGRWEETIRAMHGLGPKIRKSSISAQTKVCTEIAKKVKAHLRNQDLGWKPLDPEYAKQKASAGLDNRTLISWGNYYHAIEVWKPANRSMVFVGVKSDKVTYGTTGKKSRLPLAKIAALHEFSRNKKLPKRPLWNPTIREIGGVKGIKTMYLNSLTYHLRKNGVPVKQIKGFF